MHIVKKTFIVPKLLPPIRMFGRLMWLPNGAIETSMSDFHQGKELLLTSIDLDFRTQKKGLQSQSTAVARMAQKWRPRMHKATQISCWYLIHHSNKPKNSCSHFPPSPVRRVMRSHKSKWLRVKMLPPGSRKLSPWCADPKQPCTSSASLSGSGAAPE